MKRKERKKERGQAIVEYILLVAILCFIALGLNNLSSRALAGYFKKIAKIRTDYSVPLLGAGP